MTQDRTPEQALKQIEGPLRLTWLGLWAERLVRAFWPLWTLAIAALAALAFGVQDHLPLEALWFGTVSLVLGLLWAVVAGVRAFQRPRRIDALLRLDGRLAGQPIAALLDSQSIGTTDAASRAVWQAHRLRMATRAASATAVEPDLRLASRDPFALRYVALTALVMAVIFGSVWRLASLSSLGPNGGAVAADVGPSWEGWAQPPAYTGKPALYLNDQTASTLTLPTGSRLQIRLYGEPGSLILTETVSARTEMPPASDPAQDFVVTQSGTLGIEGAGGREWAVVATPDTPPTIAMDGKIGREADGRFKQPFVAADDYGVTKAQVTIALDLGQVTRSYGLAVEPEATAPLTLDMPLPVTGKRDKIKDVFVDDLSKHVFANMPVTMAFTATDAAGQTGSAPAQALILPGKRFFDPLAAALIEMRRDILWSRSNAPRAVQVLKAVTTRPEGFIRNEKAYLRLRVALKRLDAVSADLTPEARDEIAEELWQVALLVEEGDLASALERLQRAQDRLDEAIKNGASPEEIQELMDELRQALKNYTRELAQNQDPDAQTSENGQGMSMTQDQLQQMLDKLQQLMEEGKTAEAAELMEQLRQFMENMQVAQGEGGEGGEGSPGGKAMRELGDALRGQQDLSDDAFRDLQDGEEGNTPDQGENGEGGEGGEQKSLAERQKDLRDRLNTLEGQGTLPGANSPEGEAGRDKLGDAGRAMDEAEEALRDGDLGTALDKQAEAMEAMRDGMRNFGEALAQEDREGSEPSDDQRQAQDPNSARDPLGRTPGENSATIGSDRNALQGENVYRRAQDLLDEIRKRSGELTRPEQERNYLKRLLDLF